MNVNINLVDYLQELNANNREIVSVVRSTIEELENNKDSIPEILIDYIIEFCEDENKESKEMIYDTVKEISNGELAYELIKQIEHFAYIYDICSYCGCDESYYSDTYEENICRDCGMSIN